MQATMMTQQAYMQVLTRFTQPQHLLHTNTNPPVAQCYYTLKGVDSGGADLDPGQVCPEAAG